MLHDLTLRTCTYCGAAFFQESDNRWTRVWHTDDGGATWSLRERTCRSCGATVTNPGATICAMCGGSLPPLAPHADPRPTTSIAVQLPPVPEAPGRVTVRVQHLVRYLDNHWWPVPPSVPRAIAGLLPLLPDACPCGSGRFVVGLANGSRWVVVCSACKRSPEPRTDAPANFPRPV